MKINNDIDSYSDKLNFGNLKPIALVIFAGSISMFIFALVVSAITASKLYEISILGSIFAIPVGTSLFAITFISTDVISEVWGPKVARILVWWGFIIRVLMVAFLYFAVSIEPAPFWQNQDAYASVLSGSTRILIAAIATYPVSQFVDIAIFHALKKRQRGKNKLWLRNNVSTFISQLVDSSVFVTIAFFGTVPTNILISIIVGQVAVKWFIAVLDTPVVYFFRNLALGRNWNDVTG